MKSGAPLLPAGRSTLIPSDLRRAYRSAAFDFKTSLVCGPLAIAAACASIAVAPTVIGVLGAGLAVLMLAIAIIDRRSFIIPDALNTAAFVLALAHAAVQEHEAAAFGVTTAAMRGATLALTFLAVRNLYKRIRDRDGIGLGDVKLAGVAGAWLDWSMMSVAVQVATAAALSVYLVRHLAWGHPLSGTSRLPFGLFFAPAIWASWLLENMMAPL